MAINAQRNLTGIRVLVVEDDYLLAWDTVDTLSKVGAEVVGPVSNEADALEAIRQGNLDAAVTDVNLGRGPSFEIAGALKNAGVPFVFVTGYDQFSIPAEFKGIPNIVKPLDTTQIAKELAQLLDGTARTT